MVVGYRYFVGDSDCRSHLGTAMFTGKFEEFRLSVNQRLDRIERTLDRTRGPANVVP